MKQPEICNNLEAGPRLEHHKPMFNRFKNGALDFQVAYFILALKNFVMTQRCQDIHSDVKFVGTNTYFDARYK